MNEIQIAMIKSWQTNLVIFTRGHYKAAERYRKYNLYLGIVAVALSTSVGTWIFSQLSESSDPQLKIAAGLACLLAAVLASLQTFMRHSEHSEKHKTSGARFAALWKELDQLLVLPPENPDDLTRSLNLVRNKWDELSEESPTIPTDLYKITKNEVKLKIQQ